MPEIATEITDQRAQVLARLSVLQRLRDQAVAGDRASMFASIDRLINAESQALNRLTQPVSGDRPNDSTG